MAAHAKRYTLMPIPPIDDQTRFFDAGAITIGVEYRLLNNDIVNQHMDAGTERIDIKGEINDCGVSLHVYGKDAGGKRLEHLRFDCFDDDPHYHYVDWQGKTNDIVHIDPIADGDPLAIRRDVGNTTFPFGKRLGHLQFSAISGFGIQNHNLVGFTIGLWQPVFTKCDQ